MRLLLGERTLAVITIAVLMVGCSGAQQVPTAQSYPSSWKVKTTSYPNQLTAGIYVSLFTNWQNGIVLGYPKSDPKNKGPVCNVTSGLSQALGMTTDAQGNLYVANQLYGQVTGNLLIFAPNCGAPTATIADPFGGPVDVALHGSKLYLGNQFGPSYSPANVAVCTASGCPKDLTLSKYGGIAEMFSVAVDHWGNVYATGYLTNPPFPSADVNLVEWPKGSNPGKVIANWAHGIAPVWIQFDNQGNLVSVERTGMYVWSGCPEKCKVHGPFLLSGSYSEQYFKFGEHDGHRELVVANVQGSSSSSVDVYGYHGTSGVKYKYSVTNGVTNYPLGIAIYPPVEP